jgi:hypothetical protein
MRAQRVNCKCGRVKGINVTLELPDGWWAEQAKEAQAKDYLVPEETMRQIESWTDSNDVAEAVE